MNSPNRMRQIPLFRKATPTQVHPRVFFCPGSLPSSLFYISMALSLSVLSAGFSAPVAPVQAPSAQVSMSSLSELKELAKAQNPVIGYFDPLK